MMHNIGNDHTIVRKSYKSYCFLFKNTIVFLKRCILTKRHMFFVKDFIVYAELNFFSAEGFTLHFLYVSMEKITSKRKRLSDMIQNIVTSTTTAYFYFYRVFRDSK